MTAAKTAVSSRARCFLRFCVSCAFLSFFKAGYIGLYRPPVLIIISEDNCAVYKGSPPICEKRGGGLPPFLKISRNAACFSEKEQKMPPAQAGGKAAVCHREL